MTSLQESLNYSTGPTEINLTQAQITQIRYVKSNELLITLTLQKSGRSINLLIKTDTLQS